MYSLNLPIGGLSQLVLMFSCFHNLSYIFSRPTALPRGYSKTIFVINSLIHLENAPLPKYIYKTKQISLTILSPMSLIGVCQYQWWSWGLCVPSRPHKL